ncbi:DivIVA domain-containing protein [Georgenia sp. EYE_87]|uniref:DivIVA domain-containing protein n=1 Tax=Georgenia sp. EYE_87 TaxID=2853448 RepID=UPI0020033B4F|nr:DivIVA domain-containing protein [Georgenia sp. EYE_87]MCK6212610.1 DivIVA domain-containing protein [Georgenia sp. EYE_87]
MALLTADDVLNKKFQPTKFREGYDQDEVDDFLDEVVNTLRVVTGENEELKAKLAAAERRIAELTREGGNGARPASADTQSPAEAGPEVVEQGAARPVPAAAPVQPAPVQAAPVQAAAPVQTAQAGGNEPESATGMLALAQRLHDEYVRNGKEEGERIVTEAQAEGQRIIKEAEDQHNRTLTQLEQERSLLERKIDELRTFERDYRTRLKSYLESLLANVESGAPKAEGI